MIKVGFIGWRGMVGSVLIKRMIEESDFSDFDSYFFSTSQAGQKNPEWNISFKNETLIDAFDIQELSKMDILMSCQGGEYTSKVFSQLRKSFKLNVSLKTFSISTIGVSFFFLILLDLFLIHGIVWFF